jgi:ABC-type transport system substrate-binding protein
MIASTYGYYEKYMEPAAEKLKEYLSKPLDKKLSVVLWNIIINCEVDWKESGYNETKFIKLLKNTKWLYNKFELKFTMLIFDGSNEWGAVSSIFKEDLRKIGVHMKIKKVGWAVMQEMMDNKTFDAFTGGWGLSWDSDPYQIWHSTQIGAKGGSNVIGFNNPEADEIMETLRETFDKKKRKQLIDEFQEILYREQPYTFVFSRKYVAIWWDYLKNVKFSKLSPHELSLPWYIIPH